MKLFWFLIAFIHVNVSAYDEAYFAGKYKETVFITNEIIEFAYNKNDLIVGENFGANGLEYVIEKIVNNEDYYKCFAKMNFMITIPDKTDIVLNIPEMQYLPENWIMTRCNYYQFMLQLDMINTLDIPIPEPHHDVDFGSLDLTTLAEQRRYHVKQALTNIFERELGPMYNEFIFQLEIRDTINTEGLNLTTLTEERRVTGAPLENLIRHVLGTGTSKDDEDQRTGVSEVVEDQRTDVSEVVESENRPAHDPYLFRMCRLMGLYMSTTFPASYIKEIQIDLINYTCSLNEGHLQRRLKKINEIWWQISSTA